MAKNLVFCWVLFVSSMGYSQISCLEIATETVGYPLSTNYSEIKWTNFARKMLGDRDRFTKEEIVSDFRRNPFRGTIRFNPEEQLFVTLTSRNRFSVVWQLVGPEKDILVLAIIPTQPISSDPVQVRAQMEQIIAIEKARHPAWVD